MRERCPLKPWLPPRTSRRASSGTLADLEVPLAQRITTSVSKERGTSPEYPDLRHLSTAGPAGPPPEHSQHDIDRIAGERSREDEALRGRKRRSLWRRLFGR